MLAMVTLRTGGTLAPQALVDDAVQVELPAQHETLAASMLQRWIVGTAAEAGAQIRELAERFGVDEVMINPVAGARTGTAADTAPERERTLRELAAELA